MNYKTKALDEITKHVYTTDRAEEIAHTLDLMDMDQQEKFVSIFLQKLEDDFNGHVIVFFIDKAQEMIDNYLDKTRGDDTSTNR